MVGSSSSSSNSKRDSTNIVSSFRRTPVWKATDDVFVYFRKSVRGISIREIPGLLPKILLLFCCSGSLGERESVVYPSIPHGPLFFIIQQETKNP